MLDYEFCMSSWFVLARLGQRLPPRPIEKNQYCPQLLNCTSRCLYTIKEVFVPCLITYECHLAKFWILKKGKRSAIPSGAINTSAKFQVGFSLHKNYLLIFKKSRNFELFWEKLSSEFFWVWVFFTMSFRANVQNITDWRFLLVKEFRTNRVY